MIKWEKKEGGCIVLTRESFHFKLMIEKEEE
jgi:hypothetical protein